MLKARLALLAVLALATAQPIWQQFLNLPNSTLARDHLQQLTSRPHLAGTEGDLWTADFVESEFRSYGLTVKRYSFDVYLPFPGKTTLRGIAPFQYEAKLEETAFPQDPSTSDPNVTPTYNGYSPAGTVTGQLVYVNYGTVEDFAMLAQMNVSVKGRIALVRYGGIYRGDKSNNAADAGAIGCLIYSDPETYAPNGTAPSQVYPYTRWLPEQGVQRGSIFEGFGDPLTPGWPAPMPGQDAERIDPSDPSALLARIPTQPISYADAKPLLLAMGGPVVPTTWQGGLPLQYHTGPSVAQVQLSVTNNNTIAQINNVCAMVPGSESPDRVILLGNHRDAWVYGAADPNSGTAVMLEIARSYGVLGRQGWVPRRTIMMCSWDAEEAGTIGSTEWVERNLNLLSVRLVTYINVDTAVSGSHTFTAGAMPSLDNMLFTSARMVPDPANPSGTLYDAWKGAAARPTVVRLRGCSSDFCSFVCHLGAASIDMAFADNYPMYHSVYDDFRWMDLFGDPGFVYHKAMAQMWGVLALNIAESTILPFNYTAYATEVLDYVLSIDKLLVEAGAPTSIVTRPLRDAQQRFMEAAKVIHAEIEQRLAQWGDAPRATDRTLDDRLIQAERAFLSQNGLNGPAEDSPTRSWYRHTIYAPSQHNGYASTVFPGIVDAVDWAAHGGRWSEVQHQIWEVARAIDRAANVLVGDFQ